MNRVKLFLPWVLFALAAIAAAIFASFWLQETSADKEADDVRAVATEVAESLTNFSAQTIDRDVAEIRRHAVGEFAEEVGVFFGEEAVAAIEEAEGGSEGEVESVYVQEVDGDDASAFAVATQTVTNAGLSDERTDTIRLEIDLVRTPGGWKANKVDILQSPGTTLPGGLPG